MRWLFVLALAVSACKGNPDKCDKACRNYATLIYWKQADADIAAAPVEQREELRKQKLAKFTADLEHGITMCTSQCTSATATNDKQADCMIEAKTAEAAKACASD
jgi:hypothetical protein